jgi:hypothetical protein
MIWIHPKVGSLKEARLFRKIHPSSIGWERFKARAPSHTVIADYALKGQMRSKAHTALTALFGFTSYKDLQTRYEKNNFQGPNAE